MLAAAALAVPQCPIDRAVYRLNTAPEFTAGFIRQDRRKIRASDLVFWLKSPQRTYFFAFFAPNGHSGTYIGPDIDPRISATLDDDAEFEATKRAAGEEPMMIEFDAFDPALKPYDTPPQADSPPPVRLFARQLVQALWYNVAAAAGNDEKAAQESIPAGMFEPAGCGGPPRPLSGGG
jgi:hypothetical protein